MRSLIDTTDFSKEEILELIRRAEAIALHPETYAESCHGRKLATLFFEPSTRTRLSFAAAMMELGGNVLGFEGASGSSVMKGESIADTVKVVSCYADIIAMRSPVEGAALVASRNADVPVINAGDGGHCHPTQTLTDLLTIYREKGTLDHLTVGFCGDLKYGRTVHSLIAALSRYEDIRLVLISPKELSLPEYMKTKIEHVYGMPYTETEDLEGSMPSLDILYMTRIQRERFSRPEDYERLKDSYILTEETMRSAKPDMRVLHPLPRVNEISVRVDNDPRAAYFRQALNGKYIRMALILKLLEDAKLSPARIDTWDGKILEKNGAVCRNPKCVTCVEQELEPVCFTDDLGKKRCIYCEQEISGEMND